MLLLFLLLQEERMLNFSDKYSKQECLHLMPLFLL